MENTIINKSIDNPFTWRAFLAGSLGSLAIGVGTQYGLMVIHGSYMAIDFSTAGAIFLFFVLVALINAFIGKLSLRASLTSSELKTVYTMMTVACAIPTMGLTAQILPILTAPFYYALPENSWAEVLHPHIKPWLVPQGKRQIKYFYEGSPAWDSGVPWGIWIKPLLIWSILLLSLYFVMICITVILRKQWMDRERLVYPLAQLPLEMVKDEGNSPVKPFFKNGVMWIGFGIPFILSSMKGLHHYFPSVPSMELVQSVPIFRRSLGLHFRLSFPMLGFFYLVHLDTAFSLWFFNLLSLMVRGIMNTFGVSMRESLGIYGTPSPVFAHQGMGAMITLVLAGLWIGRSHLKDVLKKAFTRNADVDDSGEMLSYRTAVFGTIIGLIIMTIWLNMSGMPLSVTLLFLFGAMLLFIGLTRVVAESGMAEAVASTISSSFVVSGLGTGPLGPQGLTAMSLTYVWSGDLRTFVMASSANSLKVMEGEGKSRKPLFGAMILAIIITMISSAWVLLRLAYDQGGLNCNSWFFGGGARAPFDFFVSKIMNPTEPNWLGWYITAGGAAVMWLLMFMRARFLWWPFHPIGFAIGPVWIMDHIWFTIFMAWLIKTIVVRYGGLKLFQKMRPLFLGLILGQFTCNGTWLVIDAIAGGRGNMIFWI
ncbi:hypothetical protein GF312_14220 [Candidatus Poribacteria bacterium]|nr:hypothetical protein [Candidatus Poribacteria bacterium]